jgi:hypothetical protein
MKSASKPTTENMMKGQAFRSFLDAYEIIFDAEAKARLIALLPTELSDATRFGGIVASGWYPMSWYCALYEAMGKDKMLSAHMARRIGRETTARDIKGVYSFILRFASPTMVFANINRILGLYVQRCEASILHREDGRVRVRIEIPGSNRWVWEEFSGGAEAILDACGAKSTKCTITLVREDLAELEAHWTLK